jgi:hypothetical protein
MYMSIIWGEVKTATLWRFAGEGMVTVLPIKSVTLRVVAEGAGLDLTAATAAVVVAGAWVGCELLLEQPGMRLTVITMAIISETRTTVAFFIDILLNEIFPFQH